MKSKDIKMQNVNSKTKLNQNSWPLKQNVTNVKRTFCHQKDLISKQRNHISAPRTQIIAFAQNTERRTIIATQWIELYLMIRKTKRKLISARQKIFLQSNQMVKKKKQKYQWVYLVIQVSNLKFNLRVLRWPLVLIRRKFLNIF